MRIPVKENNAVLVPQNVAPSQSLPNAPTEVFGGGIANTLNSVGISVGKASEELARWQARQAEIADEGILNDMRRSYLSEFNEKLTSMEIDEKTQKQKGLLARQRGNAVGITLEYDGIFDEVKNKTLTSAQGLSINAQRRLAEYLEKDNFAKRISVAEHEANEKLSFEEENHKNDLSARLEAAVTLDNPDILRVHIEDAYEGIDRYYALHGMPAESASLAKKDFAGKMLQGSVNKILQQEGIGKARETLDTMRDDVNPEVYNALSKGVDIWGIEAVIVDDPTKANPVIDAATFFSPFEKEKYKKDALYMVEKNKNTIFEKPIKDFVSKFDALYDDDPDLAFNFFTQIENDINSNINPAEKYKLDTRQMSVAYEYMSKQLGGDIYFKNKINKEKVKTIREQEAAFNQIKADYQAFGIDKKTGLIKNDVSIGNIANFIQTLEVAMTSGAVGARDTDIIGMQEQLRYALGQIALKDGADIKEKAGQIKITENLFGPDLEKMKQNSFFRSPKDMVQEGVDMFSKPDIAPILKKPYTIAYNNETYLKERIVNIKEDEVFFNLLSNGDNAIGAKHLGLLWETVYKEAMKEPNFNMKANDMESQKKIIDILSRTKRTLVQNLYGLEDGDYEEVLINGQITKLSIPETVNPRKGYLIPSYSKFFEVEEQADGTKAYIRRNRANEIMEIQKNRG